MKRTRRVVEKYLSIALLETTYRFYDPEIVMSEPLPDSSFILCANHASHLDWMLLYVLFAKRFGRIIHFMAKQEMRDSFTLRILAENHNAILIDRRNFDKNLFFSLTDLARETDRIIGIFPEGTRSVDGRLLRGKKGAITLWKLANEDGELPLVPVGIRGTHEAFGKHARVPRRRPIAIHVGAPMRLSDPDAARTEDELMQAVMSEIARLSGQPVPAESSHVPDRGDGLGHASTFSSHGTQAIRRGGQDRRVDPSHGEAAAGSS